jgi:serine/threonine protein kinase
VTDFGYSTHFWAEDDLILLPRSWPWYAPEHSNQGVKPAQARKMDMFSVGMLCFWVLFEPFLSGSKPLPKDASLMEYYLKGKNGVDTSTKVLQELKQDDRLGVAAYELISVNPFLDISSKEALKLFFVECLPENPDLRCPNLTQIPSRRTLSFTDPGVKLEMQARTPSSSYRHATWLTIWQYQHQ